MMWGYGYGCGSLFGYGAGSGWGGGLLLLGVLAAVVAIVLGVRLVRASRLSLAGYGVPSHTADAALDAIRVRYARGELTREQFEAVRRDLQG